MESRHATPEEQGAVFRSMRNKNQSCFDCPARNPVSFFSSFPSRIEHHNLTLF